MRVLGPDVRPSPVLRFTVPLPEHHAGPAFYQVAFSPDGDHLAVRVGNRLHLRAMDRLDSTRVIGIQAQAPFFSIDGQWLGFFDQGQLQKIAVSDDSPPVALCDATGVFGASWGDDGMIVFAQEPGGVYRVSENGGEPEVLIPLNDGEIASSPQVLPGGDAILFTWRPPTPIISIEEDSQIVVQSLERGERKVLIEGGRSGRYAPTGHMVYSVQGTILAASLDVSALELSGGSVPVIENMMPVGPFSGPHFGFSESGALAYVPDSARMNTVPMWVSHDGREEPLQATPMPYRWGQLSRPTAPAWPWTCHRQWRTATSGFTTWSGKRPRDSPSTRRAISFRCGRRMVRESSFTPIEREEGCSGNGLMAPVRWNT